MSIPSDRLNYVPPRDEMKTEGRQYVKEFEVSFNITLRRWPFFLYLFDTGEPFKYRGCLGFVSALDSYFQGRVRHRVTLHCRVEDNPEWLRKRRIGIPMRVIR